MADGKISIEIEIEDSKFKSKLKSLESSSNSFGKQLSSSMTSSSASAKKSLESLGQSSSNTAKKLDETKQSAQGAGEQMGKTGQQTDDMGKHMQDADGHTTRLGQGFTVLKGIAANLAAQGIAMVADKVKDMGVQMIEAAADVKAMNSQYTQTFGKTGTSVRKEADSIISNISKNTGILDTRLQGSATRIYGFAKASGGTSKESLDLMSDALQVAADNAAYYDTSLEDSTETLQSFMKGNFENDAALGVSCTETTRNAEAMKLFGQKYQDLSEIQKQRVLLQMVKDAQEASGAVGQAARESDGWENVMGNLKESWKQFLAVVGTPVLNALVPLIQSLTGKMSGLKDKVKQLMNDWKTHNGVAGKVRSIMENLSGPIKAVGVALLGVATALLALKAYTVIVSMVTAIKGFVTAVSMIKSLSGAFALLKFGIAALGGPVTVVIAIIGALVAAFLYFYKTNDGFREKVNAVWDAFKDTVQNVFTTVSTVITNIITFITNLVTTIVTTGQTIYTTISTFITSVITWFTNLPSNIQTAFDTIVNAVITWGSNLVTNGVTAVSNFVSNVVSTISGLPGQVASFLSSIISNVASWAGSMASQAVSAGTRFLNGVVTYMSQLPSRVASFISQTLASLSSWVAQMGSAGARAASTLASNVRNGLAGLPGQMASVGSQIVHGIIRGVEGAAGGLFNSLKNLASNALNAAKSALKIGSPSRVFAREVGQWIPKGITMGVDMAMPSTLRTFGGQIDQFRVKFGRALDGSSEALMLQTGLDIAQRTGISDQKATITNNNFSQTINSAKVLQPSEMAQEARDMQRRMAWV